MPLPPKNEIWWCGKYFRYELIFYLLIFMSCDTTLGGAKNLDRNTLFLAVVKFGEKGPKWAHIGQKLPWPLIV